MIKILKSVVNQAPKVNQETVDNVKDIIAHFEKANIPVQPVKSIYDEQITGEKITIKTLDEPAPYTGNLKKRAGRPKKRK
jgi:hypothetical protein